MAAPVSPPPKRSRDTHDYSAGFSDCVDPVVTFFVVRWDGSGHAGPVDTTSWNWGPSNSSVSDVYIAKLFDAIHARLGPQFNVHTCRIADSSALRELTAKIQDGAVLPGQIPGQACATAVVGLYFLWPTCFRDGASACSSSSAGFVEEDAAFSLLRAVEVGGWEAPTLIHLRNCPNNKVAK